MANTRNLSDWMHFELFKTEKDLLRVTDKKWSFMAIYSLIMFKLIPWILQLDRDVLFMIHFNRRKLLSHIIASSLQRCLYLQSKVPSVYHIQFVPIFYTCHSKRDTNKLISRCLYFRLNFRPSKP
jgi:hypothetical protein